MAALKFLFLFMIWRLLAALFGNPWLAVLVLLAAYYVVDRRYIGLLPSFRRPLRRWRRMAELKRTIAQSPHHADARYELAGLHMERKNWSAAQKLLETLPDSVRESPDVQYDEGVCAVALGDPDRGERLMRSAVAQTPNLRYGEPYLRLAALHVKDHPEQALADLHDARKYNESSCQALYQMASLYHRLGQPAEATAALRQCLDTYRWLPRFRRRTERRWALLARLRLLGRG
ncbi:tetratricopeptide repeat protein [Alicyclobacillus shizuokensis]|uniref:tetratricopeptide repeat protein n=1 Tax=Alicyclobacillus shizuokensis TaxID=392014 RepID=UPI00082FAF2C|nr:tetratricopeptide repeat protein [Alicyclobacillus shizuokensis]